MITEVEMIAALFLRFMSSTFVWADIDNLGKIESLPSKFQVHYT